MKILGINDGHNAAACLYVDGRVAAAVQEERLRRVKNWSGMPSQAIDAVLKITKSPLEQIDFVAMNGDYAAYAMSRNELMDEYRTINDPGVTIRRVGRRTASKLAKLTPLHKWHRLRSQRRRVRDLIEVGISPEKIIFVDHHTAHAAAAYYGLANFVDDILVLTCDGSGDGLCATVNIGRKGRIQRIHEVGQADSIGNLYAMITFLMGMVPLEHEYKLMGLAPYADSNGAEQSFREFHRLIEFDPKNPLVWRRAGGCPETYCSYKFFRKFCERKRFDSIAGGLQRFTERILSEWVRRCVEQTGIRKLALSGGIFMNVKANQRILELSEVEELFVYPSCGDETNAMGAASFVYAEKAGASGISPLRDIYWGPEFTDAQVGKALADFSFAGPVTYRRFDRIEPVIAELLAKGNVVARFKGREEFGARAQGNRSILANPSNPDVVREINEAIKARDFWMPFAPSILAERSDDYLVNPKGAPAPYMILSFDTTARNRELIAAIHPFDFTARPQVVAREWNPSYHALLREFEARTGIGGVLNTSFNLHGYPIVSRPEDALDVLNRSGLKYLAIENWLVEKQ